MGGACGQGARGVEEDGGEEELDAHRAHHDEEAEEAEGEEGEGESEEEGGEK